MKPAGLSKARNVPQFEHKVYYRQTPDGAMLALMGRCNSREMTIDGQTFAPRTALLDSAVIGSEKHGRLPVCRIFFYVAHRPEGWPAEIEDDAGVEVDVCDEDVNGIDGFLAAGAESARAALS